MTSDEAPAAATKTPETTTTDHGAPAALIASVAQSKDPAACGNAAEMP